MRYDGLLRVVSRLGTSIRDTQRLHSLRLALPVGSHPLPSGPNKDDNLALWGSAAASRFEAWRQTLWHSPALSPLLCFVMDNASIEAMDNPSFEIGRLPSEIRDMIWEACTYRSSDI